MKRVKYETLGDLLDQRKAEQEQPTGQQETIDRAAERVATWPEWKRNAVRYRDDSGQQAAAEIPLEQMSDEQLDAALQAYGLDLQAVLEHGFKGICKALLKKSEELIRAEAELVQIKERYTTYRAASSAQAKLFDAQIELLKEQLAAAQRETPSDQGAAKEGK